MYVFQYRIHPSVGIARMGDSPDVYFLGREKPVDRLEPKLEQIPGRSGGLPGSGFRDENQKLAKQGQRFRIFCYAFEQKFWSDDEGDHLPLPKEVWEVTSDEYEIEWKVKVANLKSRDGATRLPNEPDALTFDTGSAADAGKRKTFTGKAGANHSNARVDLGSAFVDGDGHLVILGSDGTSRAIDGRSGDFSGLRWRNWEDDSADGWVRATVKPKSGSPREDAQQQPLKQSDARQAWVVVNMPDYGVDTPPAPSLYDLAVSHALANRSWLGMPMIAARSYHTMVRPVLRAYAQAPFVSPQARRGHADRGRFYDSPPDGLAANFFKKLRPPWKPRGHVPENYWSSPKAAHTPVPFDENDVIWVQSEGAGTYGARTPPGAQVEDDRMPKLQFLAYPWFTHSSMARWKDGSLQTGTRSLFTSDKVLHRPLQLDVSALGWLSGGSFFPGIETGRDVHDFQKWSSDWSASGWHVDVRFGDPANPDYTASPGAMTENLAVPWQSDFYECKDVWWPNSRPIEVKRGGAEGQDWMAPISGRADLVQKWMKLGFIRFQDSGPDEGEWHEEGRLPLP